MLITIGYKPSFLRDFKKLPLELQEDIRDKIELFKTTDNHERLKVHKLKGRLKNCYSFSVSYSYRIVFKYETKQKAIFLAVDDHNVYK
ncbi:MAG: mRNA interferase YafQ [Candidatus Paceibacteria bacterium]|jgi:addiction module RelE/StbE family toxin